MATVDKNSKIGAQPARPKTGGRVKKSVDQMLIETRVRNELAPYDDTTDIPAALAALYLGISEDKLLEIRNPSAKDVQANGVNQGPPFYKLTLPGAVGQNQGVMYPLGGLREYKKKNMGVTSHEVAVKSGMLGWVSTQQPFFAQLEERRQPILLIAQAWDFDEPDRDELFVRAARGEVRILWMPPADAAKHCWDSEKRHQAFAKPWLQMIESAGAAVRGGLEESAFLAIAKEAQRGN